MIYWPVRARTGCQWELLPHDLLPKSAVWDYFQQWRADGAWQRIVDALRTKVRVAAGREPTPRVAYRRPESSAAWVRISAIGQMLRRLAPDERWQQAPSMYRQEAAA